MTKNTKRGFTLIELLLYLAIAGLFVTSAIFFAWDVLYGREKAYQNQLLEQNVRIALARIAYEIRRATSVQSISADQIVLDTSGTLTTIAISSGKVEVTSGLSGPYSLTSNQVEVTDLTFTDLGSPDNNSENISVGISVRQGQAAVSGQLAAEFTASHSVELKGPFNMARSLLTDTTGSSLSSTGLTIEGINLQIAGSSDITISQLTATWTGTASGIHITGVQIGGGVVEWTGSRGSGSTIDITDYTLQAGDPPTSVDYLQFDGDMAGAEVELLMEMSDGSTAKVTFSPETPVAGPSPSASPGASPLPSSSPMVSPGPIPTPVASPATCTQACINSSYSTGTCRKNAANCTSNGQIYLPAGNEFCTGGPNADTCCCSP